MLNSDEITELTELVGVCAETILGTAPAASHEDAHRMRELMGILATDVVADASTVAPLVAYAEGNDVDAGDLDDVVHEAKANEASVINNGGLDAQIEYLVRFGGVDWLRPYLTR